MSLASFPGSFSEKGLGTRLLVSIGGTSVTYGVIQAMRYISHGRAIEVCVCGPSTKLRSFSGI